MLEDGVDPGRAAPERGRPGSRIGWQTAFHLATAGGGAVLDLPVGAFRPGLHCDALVIDPTRPEGTVRLLDGVDDREALLARILHTASRPNIAAVYVDGVRRGNGG
jgi:guanine deaminase